MKKKLELLSDLFDSVGFIMPYWVFQFILCPYIMKVSKIDAHKLIEPVFVDQDEANEYCQDKEQCDNNTMTTVNRINNCISAITLCSRNILFCQKQDVLGSLVWNN